MYIKKDASSYFTCNYPIETPDDCYVVFDERMEQIVLEFFPDIEFVVEDDELVDIVPTKEPEPSIDEKIEKNTADIAYIAMMTDVDIED